MTCYQISHGGEPFAFVADIVLARAILECQPPGHYRVETVEVGLPPPPRAWSSRGWSGGTRRGRSRGHWSRPIPPLACVPTTLALDGARQPAR
jgi:hypothetical protein